nr:immunoglobulin heavy chain junction region [Macaca mulatta]
CARGHTFDDYGTSPAPFFDFW